MTGTELAGIVHGLPDAAYHSRPELSSTEARLLLQSPAKYRWRKDNPPVIDDSPKFDIGKAVHAKVLGQGAEVVVIDADDWRSKAARDARQEARDAGKAPLLTREFEAVNAMAESVLAHPPVRRSCRSQATRKCPCSPTSTVFRYEPGSTSCLTPYRIDASWQST